MLWGTWNSQWETMVITNSPEWRSWWSGTSFFEWLLMAFGITLLVNTYPLNIQGFSNKYLLYLVAEQLVSEFPTSATNLPSLTSNYKSFPKPWKRCSCISNSCSISLIVCIVPSRSSNCCFIFLPWQHWCILRAFLSPIYSALSKEKHMETGNSLLELEANGTNGPHDVKHSQEIPPSCLLLEGCFTMLSA